MDIIFLIVIISLIFAGLIWTGRMLAAGRKDRLQAQWDEGDRNGRSQERLSRDRMRKLEAEWFLGKPCIYVSNEWEDMLVGFVTSVDTSRPGSAVTTIKDYVHDQELVIMGSPLAYTEQRLFALLKLNPFERASIVYARNYAEQEFDKPKAEEILDPTEVLQMLHHHGFWGKVDEYNKKVATEA